MATFANSVVSDVIATTIQARSGKLADNVLNNMPLLYDTNVCIPAVSRQNLRRSEIQQ